MPLDPVRKGNWPYSFALVLVTLLSHDTGDDLKHPSTGPLIRAVLGQWDGCRHANVRKRIAVNCGADVPRATP